jgi:hypothetical protein
MHFRMVTISGLLVCAAALSFAELRAQFEEGDDAVPENSVYHESKYFENVPVSRIDNYIAATNTFAPTNTPISTDRKYVWIDGRVTLTCSKRRTWRWDTGWVWEHNATQVGSISGPVVPVPQDEEEAGAPPSPTFTGGGDARTWAVQQYGWTLACQVTDWYVNGVYSDTHIDFCWVE